MKREAKKEVCEALQAIEEDYLARLLSSYENLREEEFWAGVESLNRLVELTRKVCH